MATTVCEPVFGALVSILILSIAGQSTGRQHALASEFALRLLVATNPAGRAGRWLTLIWVTSIFVQRFPSSGAPIRTSLEVLHERSTVY